MDNPKFTDEFRIIFNYSRIIKLLSDFYIKLNFKIHDYLFNPRYKYLFLINLKHVYFIILLYSNNRYYFAFTISNINQIQFKKMQ